MKWNEMSYVWPLCVSDHCHFIYYFYVRVTHIEYTKYTYHLHPTITVSTKKKPKKNENWACSNLLFSQFRIISFHFIHVHHVYTRKIYAFHSFYMYFLLRVNENFFFFCFIRRMSQNRKKNLVSWHGQITTRHDNNKPETKKKAKWKKKFKLIYFCSSVVGYFIKWVFFHHSFVRSFRSIHPSIHPSKTFSFLLPIFSIEKNNTDVFLVITNLNLS